MMDDFGNKIYPYTSHESWIQYLGFIMGEFAFYDANLGFCFWSEWLKEEIE